MNPRPTLATRPSVGFGPTREMRSCHARAHLRAAAIEERVASYPVPVPAGLDQVRHSLRQTLLPDAVPKTTTH